MSAAYRREEERGVTGVRQAEPRHRARFAPDGRNGAVGSYAVADDGTRIYFERFSPGEGSSRRAGRQQKDAPPALLVTGLGANGRLWAPAVRRMLASGYEVIVVDNRGCGRSSTRISSRLSMYLARSLDSSTAATQSPSLK
jgi:pimeloyl-ACP methyl ester carboxylesterase